LKVLIIVPTIFINNFLSQKSIDAIEEAKLARADPSDSNKGAPETSDHNSDTIVEPDIAHPSEEDFEFEDEEAMIEGAHEVQRQLDAANPKVRSPPSTEKKKLKYSIGMMRRYLSRLMRLMRLKRTRKELLKKPIIATMTRIVERRRGGVRVMGMAIRKRSKRNQSGSLRSLSGGIVWSGWLNFL
jgi:hypothetical protein